MRFSCVLFSLALFAGSGNRAFADEAAPAGKVDRSAAADEAAAPDDAELNLARLSRLEQEVGGGAADRTSPITAGWDSKRGFFIRDADEMFLLKIGARAQIRYTYKARDEDGDQSYFELERMRLNLSGHVVNPQLQYYFQFDSDSDSGGTMSVLDGYARYEVFEDFLKIGAGQYKAHFLRQERNSSANLQMVDRSLANEYYNIDRVLGLWLEGHLGSSFFYAVGMSNGFNSKNFRIRDGIDNSPGFTAKMDYAVLGDWQKYSESDIKISKEPYMSVGLSGATDANNETGGASPPSFKVHQFGVDAIFKYMGFSLQAEYMGRWLNYDTPAMIPPGPPPPDSDVVAGRNIYSHGFYVQSGYMLTDTIELAGRFSAVYGNEGANNGTGVAGGPGLNWFINGHKVKLQTDVMFFDIPDNMPRQSSLLRDTDPPAFSSSATGFAEDERGVMWRTQLQISF